MRVADLLAPERIAVGFAASSKKSVFEHLGKLIAEPGVGVASNEVYEQLLARERLGSTALGEGVAIPHCRVPRCDRALAAMVIAEQGIDFDAIDNLPVDVFFALAVPEDSTQEHLEALAQIAQMFSEDGFVDQIRGFESSEQVCDFLRRWSPADADEFG